MSTIVCATCGDRATGFRKGRKVCRHCSQISRDVFEAALVEVRTIASSKSPPRGPCECKDKGERKGYAT